MADTTLHVDDDADRKADEALARQRQIFEESQRKADAAEQQVSDALQRQLDQNQR